MSREWGFIPPVEAWRGGGVAALKQRKAHDVIIKNNEVYETCGEELLHHVSRHLIVGNLSYNNYGEIFISPYNYQK